MYSCLRVVLRGQLVGISSLLLPCGFLLMWPDLALSHLPGLKVLLFPTGVFKSTWNVCYNPISWKPSILFKLP